MSNDADAHGRRIMRYEDEWFRVREQVAASDTHDDPAVQDVCMCCALRQTFKTLSELRAWVFERARAEQFTRDELVGLMADMIAENDDLRRLLRDPEDIELVELVEAARARVKATDIHSERRVGRVVVGARSADVLRIGGRVDVARVRVRGGSFVRIFREENTNAHVMAARSPVRARDIRRVLAPPPPPREVDVERARVMCRSRDATGRRN